MKQNHAIEIFSLDEVLKNVSPFLVCQFPVWENGKLICGQNVVDPNSDDGVVEDDSASDSTSGRVKRFYFFDDYQSSGSNKLETPLHGSAAKLKRMAEHLTAKLR